MLTIDRKYSKKKQKKFFVVNIYKVSYSNNRPVNMLAKMNFFSCVFKSVKIMGARKKGLSIRKMNIYRSSPIFENDLKL